MLKYLINKETKTSTTYITQTVNNMTTTTPITTTHYYVSFYSLTYNVTLDDNALYDQLSIGDKGELSYVKEYWKNRLFSSDWQFKRDRDYEFKKL